MALTRVPTNMLSGSIMSPMTIVSGFTMADITNAVTAAGSGGQLWFPPGVYTVNRYDSAATNQIWWLSPNAIFRRSADQSVPDNDWIIRFTGDNMEIHGGVFDGNRGSLGIATNAMGIIHSKGLKIFDSHLTNIPGWGLRGVDGSLYVERCKFTNIGYAPIFYVSTLFRQVGPIILNNYVDRTSGYRSQGGIMMRCDGLTPGQLMIGGQIIGNTVIHPQVTNISQIGPSQIYEDSVNIEAHHVSGLVCNDNVCTYGKIAISTNSCNSVAIANNSVTSAYQYGIEVAAYVFAGTFGARITGNFVTGSTGQNSGASAPSRGISMSGGASYTVITGNYLKDNTYPWQANGDSATGNVIANNILS